MDTHAEQQPPRAATTPAVSTDFAHGQLARAFATAVAHPDPATRARAEQRAAGWREVLAAMRSGHLDIGSRTPVTGLPAWVTPEVLHGGFATGRARAEGPLQPHEADACRAAGIPEGRAELFAHSLTEPGLSHLWHLLDTGRYRITVPEEAALLTVAWLVRAGAQRAALDLVDVLRPFAARLRFTPPPGDAPSAEPDAVHRRTAGEASAALARRTPNRAVEAQREAITVWAPFADDLLTHWLAADDQTPDDPAPGDQTPGDQTPGGPWHRSGAELLLRYRTLAAAHPLCGKHRNPRENLAILRTALELTVTGKRLDPRTRGLLRHAVDSMVRRRGLPGSVQHTALRHAQARQAAQPSHHAVAQLLIARLAAHPRHDGLADPQALLAPVAEAESTAIPAGTAVPPALHKPVLAATSAPVETLIARGLVPSAEVLAELAPQLAAVTEACAHPDPALRALTAAGHKAFAGRRSLLLLHYARQVRAEELPWNAAVRPHRTTDDTTRDAHLATLHRLGALAVATFPGTLLPNPLIGELSALARESGADLPFVEELAADIFMGGFSPKYLQAARIAAELLENSLYERYFGIDYAAVYAMDDTWQFSALCTRRAGPTGAPWSVTGNGAVIEQAQILTTHNLATLAGPAALTPPEGWDVLAERAFTTACGLASHGLTTRTARRSAAFAWRQTLFFLSVCPPRTRAAALRTLTTRPHPEPLAGAVTDLARLARGEAPAHAPLLGWTRGA
ncbi:hypothetical protein PUR71_23190 [Streptomyces sp. SP17BM10]|uniref:hypothetical protein n=1 Tax=Streptomyces sp. SP17BM10 TaxID=3002530 RepID=UPI002E77EA77|nr:hypothetical protein [Streptomyces sp. SP17BM10]MEE1785787.1 hypothetical protein [Streptomyces sp. SP17BM10]